MMTLIERIDAAIKRITNGDAPMRVPADATDPDLVLAECRTVLELGSDARSQGVSVTAAAVAFATSPEQGAGPADTPALQVQVGGGHYKAMKIQPIEYIHANGIPFIEGSVIKYVSRWRSKNGIEDLRKARHFIDLLIELEEAQPHGT